MDRAIVYPNEFLSNTDILKLNRYAYLGLSKLAAATLGTNTLINGFACSATSPASMSIEVGAGEIYALRNLDDTAYSSLAADTAHQIVKQGIILDKTTLSCPAPGTVGFSINYLVQIAFSETDTDSASRQFKDATTGAITTTAKNQTRQNGVTVAVKAGTASTTGTQTTPAPDSGYIGAWVVTVANGATTITNGNISLYSGAPFIAERLVDKISQASADLRYLQLTNFPNHFARAALTANIDHAGTTPQIVKFDQIDINDGSRYDAATGRFTALVAGDYLVNATLEVNSLTAESGIGALIYKNGAAYDDTSILAPAGVPLTVPVTDIIRLAAGDYIEIYNLATTATTVRVIGNVQKTNFAIKLLQKI